MRHLRKETLLSHNEFMYIIHTDEEEDRLFRSLVLPKVGYVTVGSNKQRTLSR